jgi:2,3-bisphosphoglycerate-dependent phosphoglycerate mutase
VTSLTDRLLVLVRHGQSEWNLKNLFTGWRDVDLTKLGMEEARRAGRVLAERRYRFGLAFTSPLKRAQKTLRLISNELGVPDIETMCDSALNERDYGELTGLNKDEARQKWGDEQVHIWRRSYDVEPPGGESLRDTGARVWPYYIHTILPHVMRGKGVLIAAHGNSLRALIMALEGLTPEEIVQRELATGVPVVYRLNADASIASHEVLDPSEYERRHPELAVAGGRR